MSQEQGSTTEVGMFHALATHRSRKRELREIINRLHALRREEESLLRDLGAASLEAGIEASGFSEAMAARKDLTTAESEVHQHTEALSSLRSERDALLKSHGEAMAPLEAKLSALAKASEEAKARLNKTKDGLQATDSGIAKTQDEIAKAKQSVEQGRAQIPELEAKISKMEGELAALEKVAAEAKVTLGKVDAEAKTAKAAADGAKKGLREGEKQAKATGKTPKNLADKRAAHEKAQGEAQQLGAALKAAKERHGAATKKVSGAKRDLDKARSDLKSKSSQLGALDKALPGLEAKLAKAKGARPDLVETMAKAEEAANAAQEKLGGAQKESDGLKKTQTADMGALAAKIKEAEAAMTADKEKVERARESWDKARLTLGKTVADAGLGADNDTTASLLGKIGEKRDAISKAESRRTELEQIIAAGKPAARKAMFVLSGSALAIIVVVVVIIMLISGGDKADKPSAPTAPQAAPVVQPAVPLP